MSKPLMNGVLKAAAKPSRCAATNEDPCQIGSRPAALVVNRDVGELRLLRAALAKLGYQVFLAVNSHQAAALYQEFATTMAVVVLSTGQAGLDSADAFRALQSLDPHLRCCFIGGETDDADAPESDVGTRPLIRKPFCLPEIRATLRQLFVD